MEKSIIIDKDNLLQQVNLKNHYMGESLKRVDMNADIIQSDDDDRELFDTFIEEACNALAASVALRFKNVRYCNEEEYICFSFGVSGDTVSDILPFLRQNISDYLVNEIILRWLLLRYPQMSQSYISLRSGLLSNVQQQFAKLSNTRKIRRRATDLAGI